MYKTSIIIFLVLIALGLKAQESYEVEKIWNIQFKLPKSCVGKMSGATAHYWIEVRGQESHDFELHFYKTKPKLLNKKLQEVLESIPNDMIEPSQKAGLLEDKNWTIGKRHHLKMRFSEFKNNYLTIIFTFEWEGKTFIGWICAKDKPSKALSEITFLSIQPG